MTESIILRDLIRKLFYLILFLSLIVYNSYAYAMAGREHAGDMVEVLTGDRSARVPDLRAMCVDFSATIDNFKVIKGIPVGLEGHRVYGHWGFSGDIPFNKPPLSEILQRVESGVLQRGGTPAEAQSARAAVKAKIIEAWKRDVANLIRLVEAETGLTGIQAKGLAGLFYDIHLLGDWSGIKLASLQSVDDLGRDIIKNLKRLFGNNSSLSRLIEVQIKEVNKYCLQESVCRAKGILEVLKRSEELRHALSMKLAEKYPLISKFIMSKPLWKIALTLAAVSNRYSSLQNRLPTSLQQPVQGGLVSGVISASINGYNVLSGDSDLSEAIANVASDAFLTAESIYVADAILIKMGDRYALQTIAESSASSLCKRFGAAVNLGLATFIFDESRVVFNFCKGNISANDFYRQTSHSVLRSAGSFAATYCAVAIGMSPSGPIVMAVAVGSYILVDMAINKYERWQAHTYLNIDDLVGHLPLNIQNTATILDIKPVRDDTPLVQDSAFSIYNVFDGIEDSSSILESTIKKGANIDN